MLAAFTHLRCNGFAKGCFMGDARMLVDDGWLCVAYEVVT